MSGLYVASNPNALTAQFSLTRNMGSLGETLTRLSTGLRINSGKDDPAGLIAGELLKAEITGTTKAISNTQRTNSLIATADSTLGQVNNLLNDIKGLVVEAANIGAMSADQIRANQLQVDASINSIDRIAQTTTYAGKKLLDGSMSFKTSGVDGATVSNLRIDQANFGTASNIAVKVDVQQTARKGTLIYNGNGVDRKTTINVTGSIGTQVFTFGAGTTNSTMAEVINAASDSTGVTARVEGLPSRGTVELNGVGANNSIILTANEEGFEAGNYTFRIVQGTSNDARIVSEPNAAHPGVVEIALTSSYEATYRDFFGLFDLTVNTGSTSSATSVSMTTGTVNQAFLADSATSASASSVDGAKRLSVTNAGTGGVMSKLNGWTVEIQDSGDTDYDDSAKVIRTTAANLDAALQRITGSSTAVTTSLSGTLAAGDSFKLSGGAAKGELVVSYKEGATAGDILKMLNNIPEVQASLKSGVSEKTLVPLVPDSPTRVTATTSQKSAYSSGVTATELVDLLNGKLGDRFTAALKTDSSGAVNGNGLMTYMNAGATYGTVESDNALRFTGLDSGPVVRMVTTNVDGTPILNQKLGVRLVQPTGADIAAGRNTPILEIRLATDAQGHSITTASDIVDLFDRLTPAQTGGISAGLIYPDGVDPNGRTWVTDECGNVTEIASCDSGYGKGIVQPTGTVGPCEIRQNDLVLLGNNQTIQEIGYPTARIPSATVFDSRDAIASNMTAMNGEGTVHVDFGNTSALSGVSLNFTTDAAQAGFNTSNGRLTVYVDPVTTTKTDSAGPPSKNDFTDSVTALINGQIAQNWAEIREFTQTTDDPATVRRITYSNDTNGSASNYTELLKLIDSTSPDSVLNICGCSSGGIPAPAKTTPITINFDNGGFPTTADFWLTTDGNTDELNGLQIRMGNTVGDYEYDSTNNILTVKNLVGDQNDASALAGEFQTRINDALADMGFSATIAVDFIENDGFTLSVLEANILNLDFGTLSGGSSGGWTHDPGGGIGANDPALRLISNEPGTPRAGAVASFMIDETLAVGTITAFYDEERKILTVKGNPAGGTMGAEDLAQLLNADENYRKYFQEIDLVRNVTPGATVAFSSSATPPAYDFVGGYEIVTESLSGGASGGAATSSGLAMSGGTDDNQRLILEAAEYGSEHFVQVVAAAGSAFDTYCPLGAKLNRLAGTDIVATINGIAATGRGTNIEINAGDLALSMDVTNKIGGTSFTITGGGALFQLGSNVISSQQLRLGIPSILSTQLGGSNGFLYQLKSGGQADLTKSDASRTLADRIVNDAISSISTTRGRLGAIQKSSLEPNIAVLQDSLVTLTEARSTIVDADFAEESSNLTRLQLLVQSGMQTLGIANQFPQYAAQLVR